MASFNAVGAQTIAPNQNALLTEAGSYSCRAQRKIIFEPGSGLVTLRGNEGNGPCVPTAVYKVTFNANIAVSTGGTAEAISAAISKNGEALLNTNAIVTPAAVGDFFNVSTSAEIRVPSNCCAQVAIKNTSTQNIDMENLNVIVECAC